MAKKVAAKKAAKKSAKKGAKKVAAKKTRSVAKKLPAKGKDVNHFTKHLGKNKAAKEKKISAVVEKEPEPKGFEKKKHKDLPLHIRLNREAAEKRRKENTDPKILA